MPEAPRPSPRPDVAPELPQEEQTNPRIRASNSFTRLISLGVAGGFSVVTLSAVAVAYDKLEQKAVDAGTQAAKVELAPVVEAVKAHEGRIANVEQETRATREEVHDMRGELRDLYQWQKTGRRAEKLERPLPALPPQSDGGHP
jgi:TolA-binding protein